jgi:hypothetical protein
METNPAHPKTLCEKLIDLDRNFGDHLKSKEFSDFYNQICADISISYIDNDDKMLEEEIAKYDFWNSRFFPFNNGTSNADLKKWLMKEDNNFQKFLSNRLI